MCPSLDLDRHMPTRSIGTRPTELRNILDATSRI